MMSDREFLMFAFKNDANALDYALMIAKIADVWDNLIDGDKPVSSGKINQAFRWLAVDIPRNPFFRAYSDTLLPVIESGILNWMIANRMEEDAGNTRALEIAHVIRYSIADVLLIVARICGGAEWAIEVGPELRMRSQRSDFKEYIDSLWATKWNKSKESSHG